MIKKSLRAYITGSQLVKFVLPSGKAVGLLFCQFFKQQIHRILIFLVVLPAFAGIEHMFISLVRKYTRAKKLTPRMLNELVEKIEVFNAEKVNGVWEQRLRIHYNCVGTIEIPSALPLPTPDVSVNTRKGVVVNYAPCDVAI